MAVITSTLGGCSTTTQSSNERESGFLSNYEKLAVPETGEGFSWAADGFLLGNYDAVVISPVELLLPEDSKADLATEDAQRLTKLFRDAVSKNLGEHGWTIAASAAPRTLTVHLALTEVTGASPIVSGAIRLVPYVGLIDMAVVLAADVHMFVGKVSTEIQVVDSMSGRVMAEGIDRRVGTRGITNLGSTWGEVEDAMGVWAERLAKGLSKQPGSGHR